MSRDTCKPDDGAEAALPDRFFDGFQQVVAFQFLNFDFGVARDAERIGFDDLQARKQRRADSR